MLPGADSGRGLSSSGFHRELLRRLPRKPDPPCASKSEESLLLGSPVVPPTRGGETRGILGMVRHLGLGNGSSKVQEKYGHTSSLWDPEVRMDSTVAVKLVFVPHAIQTSLGSFSRKLAGG